jgi:outer membrane biosynthesis protein TonB
MVRLRWVSITFALPLVYLALLYFATRPSKAVYVFANPTVITVSDRGGPTILHGPDVVYPPQALRDRVEGSVTLKVTVGADGTVARVTAVAGPQSLRQAAVDSVRQ